MYAPLNQSTLYICNNVNDVVCALVEAFNEFVTCVVVDIDKNGIKKMTGICTFLFHMF